MLGGRCRSVGRMAEREQDKRLFKACVDGDIDAINSIVAEGADPARGVRWNPYSCYYECPLHAASQ